jgi:hypothetical protein
MSYSDGRFYTRQSVVFADIDSNASAATVQAGWKNHTAVKVLEVTAFVKGLGTATDSGWDIFKGTASIGNLTITTNTVGSFVDASLTDTSFDAADTLVLKNVISDTTAVADITVDYQETFA